MPWPRRPPPDPPRRVNKAEPPPGVKQSLCRGQECRKVQHRFLACQVAGTRGTAPARPQLHIGRIRYDHVKEPGRRSTQRPDIPFRNCTSSGLFSSLGSSAPDGRELLLDLDAEHGGFRRPVQAMYSGMIPHPRVPISNILCPIFRATKLASRIGSIEKRYPFSSARA